jgi:predicted metal-dependent enzyme (double-stranded beta helix superfamily)
VVVEEFVSACVAVVAQDRPMAAVQEVVERAVRDPALIGALPGPCPGIFTLLRDPTVSIFQVVAPPRYKSLPHDHHMWAVIGMCSGREDHKFFLRKGTTLEASGGQSIDDQEVLALGADMIHAVTNSLLANALTIQVYGGDLVSAGRSMWAPDNWTEQPFDERRAIFTTFS